MALNDAVLCVFMSIHSFVFLEMTEGGATAPPSYPPKSATAYINIETVTWIKV